LFGTIDASVTYLQNAGLASSATAPSTGVASPANIYSATPPGVATGSNFTYYDSQIFSSQWGMKGTEDLGGGMKANFYLAGDANTNAGGTDARGIFRRGAWVGLEGGFGEVRLGTQNNPIVTASAALMPVMGNTVNGVRTTLGYSAGDQNRNAIGYFTPIMNGFGAELQYAANNTMDAGLSDGTAVNLRAFYSAGALDVNAAYQKRSSMSATGNAALCGANATDGSTTGAVPTIGTGSTTTTCAAANYGGDVTGYLAGIKYKVTPAIQLGLGWAHGEGDNTNYAAGADSRNTSAAKVGATSVTAASATAVNKYNSNAFMAGVGYQATPTVLLGLNYIVTTADSSMYNFQTRYALSKRTTAYFQASMMKNGAGSYSNNTTPYGNFLPLGGQTSTSTSVQVEKMAALPNTTQSAYGVGIIHNF
jgi:predicted porin